MPLRLRQEVQAVPRRPAQPLTNLDKPGTGTPGLLPASVCGSAGPVCGLCSAAFRPVARRGAHFTAAVRPIHGRNGIDGCTATVKCRRHEDQSGDLSQSLARFTAYVRPMPAESAHECLVGGPGVPLVKHSRLATSVAGGRGRAVVVPGGCGRPALTDGPPRRRRWRAARTHVVAGHDAGNAGAERQGRLLAGLSCGSGLLGLAIRLIRWRCSTSDHRLAHGHRLAGAAGPARAPAGVQGRGPSARIRPPPSSRAPRPLAPRS